MTTPKIKAERPLSPHLQIYKWQITMAMSILHRMTGVALSLGALVFALWLYAAAYDPGLYKQVVTFFASTLGLVFLVGWSAAFYYHMCNGIRHLFWDAGKGFEIGTMTKSGVFVLLLTIVMTVCTWATVLGGQS